MNFDTALTDIDSRQFKIRTKKMAARVDFCLFLNAFLFLLAKWCLKVGTYLLINVLLTYLNILKLKFSYATVKSTIKN